MKYIVGFLILIGGYYTFTYAIHLWTKQNNKLGAFGAALIALIGTIAPIVVLWIRL